MDQVEDLLRELAPQVLAVLVRRYGDFDGAEDAVQEALVVAHTHWRDGVPEHPFGWLVTTASRRLIDHYRSEASRRDQRCGPLAPSHRRTTCWSGTTPSPCCSWPAARR